MADFEEFGRAKGPVSGAQAPAGGAMAAFLKDRNLPTDEETELLLGALRELSTSELRDWRECCLPQMGLRPEVEEAVADYCRDVLDYAARWDAGGRDEFAARLQQRLSSPATNGLMIDGRLYRFGPGQAPDGRRQVIAASEELVAKGWAGGRQRFAQADGRYYDCRRSVPIAAADDAPPSPAELRHCLLLVLEDEPQLELVADGQGQLWVRPPAAEQGL